MTHVSAFTSARPRPTDLSRGRFGLSALQGMLERHRERRRFRFDLERMLNETPHLIADIGLTRRQAEAEITKPFWQA